MRLAFVGALVVLVVGLCLVTLSGCSILPAHALGGSDAKDFQVEQSVQAVGGNYSGLSQAYQGVCQKFSDTNNDGICDTCGNACKGSSAGKGNSCQKGFARHCA